VQLQEDRVSLCPWSEHPEHHSQQHLRLQKWNLDGYTAHSRYAFCQHSFVCTTAHLATPITTYCMYNIPPRHTYLQSNWYHMLLTCSYDDTCLNMTSSHADIFSLPVPECCYPNILPVTCCYLFVRTSEAFVCCRRRLHVAHCKPNTAYLLMLSLTAGAAALIAAQYPSLSVTNMKASMLASVTPVAGLNGYCQTNVSFDH